MPGRRRAPCRDSAHKVVLVPVAPVRPLLQLAIRATVVDEQHRGAHELARRFAECFGEDPGSVERQLIRICSPGKVERIHLEFADRLATFLGLHFDNVWPGVAALDDGAPA